MRISYWSSDVCSSDLSRRSLWHVNQRVGDAQPFALRLQEPGDKDARHARQHRWKADIGLVARALAIHAKDSRPRSRSQPHSLVHQRWLRPVRRRALLQFDHGLPPPPGLTLLVAGNALLGPC